jgi:hypothetical protein
MRKTELGLKTGRKTMIEIDHFNQMKYGVITVEKRYQRNSRGWGLGANEWVRFSLGLVLPKKYGRIGATLKLARVHFIRKH